MVESLASGRAGVDFSHAGLGPWSALGPLAPLAVLFVSSLAVLLVDVVLSRRGRFHDDKRPIAAATITGIGLGAVANALFGSSMAARVWALGGMVVFDGWGTLAIYVLLTTGVLVVAISPRYFERVRANVGETYALVLFALQGMVLLAMAGDFILVFLGIELLSIALYVLCAIRRGDFESVEAGFKYFVLGSFSSGLLLYGIALVYGATGSTSLEAVAASLRSGNAQGLLLVGLALVVVGFAFKVAAVPFHVWTPDVYEGAPTTIAAFMAVGVKVATFAALGRFTLLVLGARATSGVDWGLILALLAGLSMVAGNVLAVVQSNLKRMLAWSAIANAGYVLMGLSAIPSAAVPDRVEMASVPFYLVAYLFMTIGAFAVVALMTRDGRDQSALAGLRGLAARRPLLAAALSLFLLSLAGIPPTMGFVGKFALFYSAVRGGYTLLAVIGAVAAVIGVFYYLRPIVLMYMESTGPSEEALPFDVDWPTTIVLVIAVAGTLGFGLWPEPLMAVCRSAVAGMGG
jgi:NADH-quinone oxidoreductase subunit N